MKPISCNQETGGHRKNFMPRNPTGSCLVSGTCKEIQRELATQMLTLVLQLQDLPCYAGFGCREFWAQVHSASINGTPGMCYTLGIT